CCSSCRPPRSPFFQQWLRWLTASVRFSFFIRSSLRRFPSPSCCAKGSGWTSDAGGASRAAMVFMGHYSARFNCTRHLAVYRCKAQGELPVVLGRLGHDLFSAAACSIFHFCSQGL